MFLHIYCFSVLIAAGRYPCLYNFLELILLVAHKFMNGHFSKVLSGLLHFRTVPSLPISFNSMYFVSLQNDEDKMRVCLLIHFGDTYLRLGKGIVVSF